MSGPSLRSFNDACRDLYAPGLTSQNLSTRSFKFVRRLVSAELIACGVLDTKSKQLTIGFDVLPASFIPAMEAFGSLMTRYPLYRFDPTVNHGRPFRRSQFFSERQFRDLDMFQEVYRPLGIDNHCAFHVPTQPGEVMFFGLERDGGADFSDDELSMLELAQDQLANAFALGRSLATPPDEKVDPALLAQTSLTPREAETLSWIAEGKSNAEIALLMNLSLHTVKGYAAAIFDKTGAGNRHAAILWAREACRHLRNTPVGGRGFIQVPAFASTR